MYIVKNISKTINRQKILSDISFTIDQGEIVGFVGPNGAGKSTTMKIMAGLLLAEKGTVEILGYDIQKHREKALTYISSIIENPALYPNLTGNEHLKWIARIRGAAESKINEIKNFINIGQGMNKKTKKYSLGMKQRLALGIALLSNPKFLILDEPTNGLDPTGVVELRETIKQLRDQNQITVFISSHNLDEIQKICDRIIFINDGQIFKTVKNNTMDNESEYYSFNSDNIADVVSILNKKDYILKLQQNNNQYFVRMKKNSLANFMNDIGLLDIKLTNLHPLQNEIENEYHQMLKSEVINSESTKI